MGKNIFSYTTYSCPGYYWNATSTSEQLELQRENYIYCNSKLIDVVKSREPRKKKTFLDHYLYFCSTIYYLNHVDKRYKNLEYAPINYKTMTSVISEYKYSGIVNNLIEWGIVSTDNQYIPNRKSKGYKLNQPYNTKMKKTMIKDKRINDKLNRLYETQLEELHRLPYPYQYLEMTNQWITMNTNAANTYNYRKYRNSNDMTVYDSNYYSISSYDKKDYRFVVDTTGYRAHTNITNLKKDFRKYLSVQGERLGQVDIKNSQPAFFYLYIKDNPSIPENEKEMYRELVESGRFYEYFLKKQFTVKRKGSLQSWNYHSNLL